MNFWLKNKINLIPSPKAGARSYTPLSSFLIICFFEAGVVKVTNWKVNEDTPTSSSAPGTWQVPNNFLHKCMNE